MGLVVNILHAPDRPLDDRFWLSVDERLEKQGFSVEFTHDVSSEAFARLVEGTTPDVEEPGLCLRCDEEGQAAITVSHHRREDREEDVFTLRWDAVMQQHLRLRGSYLRLAPVDGPDDSLEFFNAFVEAAAQTLDGLVDDAQAGMVTTAGGEEFDYPPDE